MEGHRGDLEAEADQQEPEPDDQHRIASALRGHRVGDAVQVGGAGGPEDEGDAVDEEAGGEGPDQQILQRGLARVGPGAEVPGEHVERDRHRLEAEEDDDEIARRRHQHHAQRGEQHQDVELARLLALATDVVHREQQHQAGGVADHDVEEERETVQHHHAPEAAQLPRPREGHPVGDHQGRDDPERAHEAEVLLPLAGGDQVEQQHHPRGEHDHQHGPERPQLDDRQRQGRVHRLTGGSAWPTSPAPWSAPG